MIRGSDVTVVIPTVPGREELLARAVASVDAQQVKPAEIVIYVDSERHGAHWARNEALTKVTTPWVAWLDDDDELLRNHLKVLVRGANRSGADLVYSYAEFVGGRDPLAVVKKNRIIAEPINEPWDAEAEWSLRVHGNFIPITYLVRTGAVRAVGGFPAPYSMPEIRSSGDCEDYLLLIKMLDAGVVFHAVTGIRTWRYHYHDGNLGGRGVNRMHELEH